MLKFHNLIRFSFHSKFQNAATIKPEKNDVTRKVIDLDINCVPLTLPVGLVTNPGGFQ